MLLRYDPEERITARHGLLSPYFEEVPERTSQHEQNPNAPTSTFYSSSQQQGNQNDGAGGGHAGGAAGAGEEGQKGTLPPINQHKSSQHKNMKPFKFRSKNFGLHSTITSGFGHQSHHQNHASTHYGNKSGNISNAYLSGMNATTHRNKFFKPQQKGSVR